MCHARTVIGICKAVFWVSNLILGISYNNNKYKTYIGHIQYKHFHMRITDDKIKIG